MKIKSKTLIVCKFNEDTNWIYQFKKDFNLVILQKYESKLIKGSSGTKSHKHYQKKLFEQVIHNGRLKEFLNETPKYLYPNIGMESHAYFSYIVENYDNLSDILVFCQGNPFDHCPNFLEELSNLDDDLYYLDFGKVLISDDEGMPTERGMPIGKVYEELFQKPSPDKYEFSAGSMFATTRENVHRHSKKFYEKCVELSIREEFAPWIFERLYKTIFSGVLR